MLFELELFREEMPVEALGSVTKAVARGCQKAHRMARHMGTGLFRDAVPAFRRVFVERELRSLALGPTVTTSVKVTPSTSYVMFETPRLVITAATRSHDVDWVEPYLYRKTLAEPLNLDLFLAEQPKTGKKLYGLLIYGGDREIPEPTLARIVFPLPTGGLLPNYVDLLTEFPVAAGKCTETPTTVIKPVVRLKDPAEETEKKSG
jgi:hypothetical protein